MDFSYYFWKKVYNFFKRCHYVLFFHFSFYFFYCNKKRYYLQQHYWCFNHSRISLSCDDLYHHLCYIFCLSDISPFSLFISLSFVYSFSYCIRNTIYVYWKYLSLYEYTNMAIIYSCICLYVSFHSFYFTLTNLYTWTLTSISKCLSTDTLDFSCRFTGSCSFVSCQWCHYWHDRNIICLFYLFISLCHWSTNEKSKSYDLLS